MIQKENQR